MAGAVQRGGVYRLPSGSRVTDAVRAAGGLGASANSDAVNLAAVLVDGQRVYIPRVGEPAPPEVSPVATTLPQGPVNLNTATIDQLDRLPGVGPATAAAIVARRQQYGPFASVDDLAAVDPWTPRGVKVIGTAMDGETGLVEAAKLKPNVVLLDLELPGMNGIQVTAKLKPRQPETEILILTTFDDEQKVYEAIQAGASGYLVKRVAGEKIVQGILDVWAGGTVLEAQLARRFWNYFQSVQAQNAPKQNPWGLNPTELDLLRYVAKGLSNAEVGRVMSMERRTIRTHLGHIYKKMGVNSHVEAVVMALKSGLFSL